MKERVYQELKNPALYGIVLIVASVVVFFYVLHIEGQNNLTYNGYLFWNRIVDSTRFTLIGGITLSIIGFANSKTKKIKQANSKQSTPKQPTSPVNEVALVLVITVSVVVGLVMVLGTIMFFVAFR